MSWLDQIDIAKGDLPPWLNNAVALARPAFTAGLVAIPSLGAFTVGVVAAGDVGVAMNMVKASTEFLKGIPDAGYGMIIAVALGYTAGKTVEAVKAKPPAGATSPEAGPNAGTPPAVDDGSAGLPDSLR